MSLCVCKCKCVCVCVCVWHGGRGGVGEFWMAASCSPFLLPPSLPAASEEGPKREKGGGGGGGGGGVVVWHRHSRASRARERTLRRGSSSPSTLAALHHSHGRASHLQRGLRHSHAAAPTPPSPPRRRRRRRRRRSFEPSHRRSPRLPRTKVW